MLGLHRLGIAGRVRLLKRILLCTACERMCVSAGDKVPSEYSYALRTLAAIWERRPACSWTGASFSCFDAGEAKERNPLMG